MENLTEAGQSGSGFNLVNAAESVRIWGRLYEQLMSPLIAFIFYAPFKLKNSVCMKRVWDYPVGLSAFKVIHSVFYVEAA